MSEASSAAPHHSASLALPPEPSPAPHVHGKTVFHETNILVPGAKNVGDHCSRVSSGVNFIILSLGPGKDLAKPDIHIIDEEIDELIVADSVGKWPISPRGSPFPCMLMASYSKHL